MVATSTSDNCDTLVVLLTFPFPKFFKCSLCFTTDPNANVRRRGKYQNHSDLMQHLKHRHFSLSITKCVCGVCGIVGGGPAKMVKNPHAGTHERA